MPLSALRCAAVALLALGVRLAWVRLHGVDVPIGPDTAMWVLVGLDRLGGNPPSLPPLYPSLISAAYAVGLSGEAAARWLSMLAGVATPAFATFWLERRGAQAALSLGVGIALALSPDLVFEAAMAQPDTLTQLWLMALGAAALQQLREPGRTGAVALVGLSAAGVLLRETGTPALLIVAGILALRPGPGAHGRLVWPLLALLAAHLAPLALGLWPAFPLNAAPWAAKASVPGSELMRVLREGWVPSYSAWPSDTWTVGEPGLHMAIRSHYDTLVDQRPGQRALQVLWLHSARARAISGELYVTLAACFALVLVGARRERRAADALVVLGLLAPVLLTLVVWTQRRHVVLYLPLATLCAALALPRRPVGIAFFVALFVAICAPMRTFDAASRWTRLRVSAGQPMAELGRAIGKGAEERPVVAGLGGASVTQASGVAVATSGLLGTSSVPDDTLRWGAVWLLLDNEAPPPGWTELTRRDRLVAYVYGADRPEAERRCRFGELQSLAPLVQPALSDRSVATGGEACGP